MTGRATSARPVLPASVLGLASACFVGDLDDATDRVVTHSVEGKGGFACLCNVHVLTTALHDERLRAVLTDAELRFPDGEPVAWLLRRLGFPQARRIGGPDLLALVADRGRTVGLRHFFAGSTEPHLSRLEAALVARYPGLEIVGRHAPPFATAPEVETAAVTKIRASGAQIVWVGLGAPKQELWSAQVARELPGVTFVGVGAAFDFIEGSKKRAPAWMQTVGLEWVFRMGSEPRRLTGRYVRSNSEFVGRTLVELSRRRLGRESSGASPVG